MSSAQSHATAKSREAAQSSAAMEVRGALEARAAAVRKRDVAGAMAIVAGHVLTFDVVGALQSQDAEATRQRTSEWFASFAGPIDFEMRHLQVDAGAEVACAHSLNHVHGTKADGSGELDMWWRSTVFLRKIDGRWQITHQHDSVPFDPSTGKASLNLKL